MAINVTAATFDEEVLTNESVLVDFWAEWCSPCKAVDPILNTISQERGLKLVKINIDEESELADRFGVRSIPTIMMFNNGIQGETVIGAVGKTAMEDMLNL